MSLSSLLFVSCHAGALVASEPETGNWRWGAQQYLWKGNRVTEERITETRTPSGDTHRTHTVITDGPARSGGGATWIVPLLVLALAIVGIYLFTQQSGAEVAKDNAIAGAADSVSDAADQVGTAAQNAGDAARDAVDGE